MKKFYGGMFIPKENLIREGIKYPIKLEYYRVTEESIIYNSERKIYGIEIVKTEYKDSGTKIEIKGVRDVTNNIKRINKILQLLKQNYVTPIGLKDVVEDYLKIEENKICQGKLVMV